MSQGRKSLNTFFVKKTHTFLEQFCMMSHMIPYHTVVEEANSHWISLIPRPHLPRESESGDK